MGKPEQPEPWWIYNSVTRELMVGHLEQGGAFLPGNNHLCWIAGRSLHLVAPVEAPHG